MPFCTNCGRLLDENGVLFCANCGAKAPLPVDFALPDAPPIQPLPDITPPSATEALQPPSVAIRSQQVGLLSGSVVDSFAAIKANPLSFLMIYVAYLCVMFFLDLDIEKANPSNKMMHGLFLMIQGLSQVMLSFAFSLSIQAVSLRTLREPKPKVIFPFIDGYSYGWQVVKAGFFFIAVSIPIMMLLSMTIAPFYFLMPASFKQALDTAVSSSSFDPLLAPDILPYFLFFCFLLLLWVVGLYIVILGLSFFSARILDGERGVIASCKQSWAMTRGYKRYFLILHLPFLLFALIGIDSTFLQPFIYFAIAAFYERLRVPNP